MQELINHINNSIEKAKNNQSNLSHEILSYDGMSSYKVRHLFNNLANHPSFKKYLEVGIYKGATSSAVIFNNNIEAILIDNWSQFSSDFNVTGTNNIFRDTKQQCLFNLNNAANKSRFKNIINVIDQDYSTVDIGNEKIDLYFYDGEHSEINQCNGIKQFYKNFSDVFMLVIDDFWSEQYGYSGAREGTHRAIKELDLKILYDIHLEGYPHDSLQKKMETWWNGIYIALLQK